MQPTTTRTGPSGRTRRTGTVTALIATAALLFTACSADDPDSADRGTGGSPTETTGPTTDGGGPTRATDDPARLEKVALQRFDDCSTFLDYVHTEGAERVGAYGFDPQQYWLEDDVLMMEVEDAAAMDEAQELGDRANSAPMPDSEADRPPDDFEPASTDAASNGEDGSDTFSETNVQVDGVDEPDIVKTDGQRVLAITGNRLVYVDIGDEGRSGERRGSANIADGTSGAFVHGQEILVSGDRAFVIANIDSDEVWPMDVAVEDVDVDTEVDLDDGDAEAEFAEDIDVDMVEPIPTQPFPGGYDTRQRTVIVEVDLSDPDDLRIANSLTVDGRYVSARSIGDTARVVVSTPPSDVQFLYPSGVGSEKRAAEANRDLIRGTTVEDWMPNYTLAGSDGTTDSGALVDCAGIHAPAEFAGFDMLSVLTLPMDESLSAPAATTSVLASGETVYASQDRMYVATNEWVPPTLDDQERNIWEETYQTGIHRFALPDGEAAAYEASGSVDGHLLNQFSMHDQNGTFFVATTTGTPWSGEGSESQIVSMQPNGDLLEQIGVVGGIGKGEQIFSVRYVGDIAYVVTFRQTDPFYVVDLSAPTDMSVSGELKIPGVSTYLHPISDSMVLGVGQEGTEDGRLTGSKVSLFDVSDPSAPREVDVWTLPNSNSDAEFDHRAFLWWAPTSTAVLPLVSWNDQFAGAVVLNITEDGITEQGRVSHIDADDDVARTDCRELTTDDVPDDSFGELFWIVQEPGTSLGLCGSEDRGSVNPGNCEVFPVDQLETSGYGFGDDAAFPVSLDGVDRIELCWDNGFDGYDQRIVRTMVIGDQLWTLAPSSLQANDLATLDRTTQVTL